VAVIKPYQADNRQKMARIKELAASVTDDTTTTNEQIETRKSKPF
jgi:hypothetical protein